MNNRQQMMVEMEIRPLYTLTELAAIESLERDIWSMSDLEIISVHTLHALVHSGGQVLGAFDGDQLIGFVVSILGKQSHEHLLAAAQLKIYSVIAGVAKAYQNQNVGYLLKLAQREFAKSIGIPQITWTYDPLESRNARFNVAKLGAVCHKYHRDFHGEMSGINAGTATDRFEVDWWVLHDRVKQRVEEEKRPLTRDRLPEMETAVVNQTSYNAAGLLMPPEAWSFPAAATLFVEIPANYQLLKKEDFVLAQRWRYHTRSVFEELFSCGYAVTDFISEEQDNVRRSFYELTKWQEL